jgi:hypothetical protein
MEGAGSAWTAIQDAGGVKRNPFVQLVQIIYASSFEFLVDGKGDGRCATLSTISGRLGRREYWKSKPGTRCTDRGLQDVWWWVVEVVREGFRKSKDHYK